MRGVHRSTEADRLLAAAFSGMYRYPADFGGFTARALYGVEGDGASATVALCGPGDVAWVADDGEPSDDDPQLPGEAMCQELRSLSRLLWGHDYAAAEGRFEKSLDDDGHALGPLVRLHDDPHAATFRVRDGRVGQMTRRNGDLLEVVRVERWHVRPDGRVIPARFVTEFWDDHASAPLRVDRCWDLYRPLEGQLVPLVRRVEHRFDADAVIRVLTLRSWVLAPRHAPT
jgi:hypothetical protein